MSNNDETVLQDAGNVATHKASVVIPHNANVFIKREDLERFFVEITTKPILKIADGGITLTDHGERVEFDKEYYAPTLLEYFAREGFFPYSFNKIENTLSVFINRTHSFMKMDIPVPQTDDEIAFYLGHYLENWNHDFFALLPPILKDKITSAANIEVSVVSHDFFFEILDFVKDPRKISKYYKEKKAAFNKDSGIISGDADSFAKEILDAVLTYGINHRATDVHFEWTGERYIARIRVDGDLQEYPQEINALHYAALINVILIRCNLDITQHFLPQDGQFQFACNYVESGKESTYHDIRVSTIPEVDEKTNVVLRIQEAGEFKTMEQLGFSPSVYLAVKRLCDEPHGFVLVTGPTGSGKTTTLYSVMNELNKPDVKCLTAEDPVEIKMMGITQVKINDDQGRTFPTILRHFLRHDPDIILVGEIRDAETAKLAITAANTGHFVLSTLHTNDAVSAIKRLANMEGVDSSDFAFCLKGILAQRLVKTFHHDITKGLLKEEEMQKAGTFGEFLDRNKVKKVDLGVELNKLAGEEIFPVGIVYGFTGEASAYEGRTAITEFWRLGRKAQDLIFDNKLSTKGLLDVATNDDHMLPMAYTGFEKVVQLQSSLENLIKVVGVDSILDNRELLIKGFFNK